tara:strand:+ start:5773 stop:6867 length:1095 start_codon:yes stop_codon:yes gene_type:complete
MFGDPFYHATMRKSVAVFGTLFNNLQVVRRNSSGNVINTLKVPLAYGPKQKFLAALDRDTGRDASLAIKLPRMAFEITSLAIDANQRLVKRAAIEETNTSDVTKKKLIKHYTTYDIGMSLYILAKNQDDGLQLVEQILPYFQPEYTVTIKPIDGWTTLKQDVPVVLTGIQINDEYEGDYTARRVLTYQLDFTMKMKFYGPASNTGIIREINIDFEGDSSMSQLLEEMDIRVTQTEAGPDDNYTVTTVIDGGGNNVQTSTSTYTLTVAAKGIGTGNAYYYGTTQQAGFTFQRGGTYVFNYPSAHPLRFSTTSNGTHTAGADQYTAGVNENSSTQIQITIDDNTPDVLYYYCTNHSAMGGRIDIVT